MIYLILSLSMIAVNTWSHATMDTIKDLRTHKECGHPYRTFWHFVQLFRDSSAWMAGGFASLFVIGAARMEIIVAAAGYVVWMIVCKLLIFTPFYRSQRYKFWCYNQDEYKFSINLGKVLNEFFGFDYNPS